MKVLPPTALLAALGAMFCLHLAVPLQRLVVGPWRFVGLLPLGAGVFFNLLADPALRQAKTTVKPDRKLEALVATGVF